MSIVKGTIVKHLGELPGFKSIVSNEDYFIFKIGNKSFGVDIMSGTFNIILIHEDIKEDYESLDLMMLGLISHI